LQRVFFRWTGRPRAHTFKDGVTFRYYPLLLTSAGVSDFEVELISYCHFFIKLLLR
jgi:hypothetical protein